MTKKKYRMDAKNFISEVVEGQWDEYLRPLAKAIISRAETVGQKPSREPSVKQTGFEVLAHGSLARPLDRKDVVGKYILKAGKYYRISGLGQAAVKMIQVGYGGDVVADADPLYMRRTEFESIYLS